MKITNKPTTRAVVYWTAVIIFSLLMLMDGIAGVLRVEKGQEGMRHLGYPIYAMSIFGIAKIIGAVVLLQNKFQTVKEWAYAGFAINFIGAFASRAFAGDGIGLLSIPLVMLLVLFLVYFLWKKYTKITVARQGREAPAGQTSMTNA